MSNEQPPQRLSRELRDRAGQVGGHPIGLDDVKRTANRMRWQQRIGAGAVAAAVLAIAVPVGMATLGSRPDDTSPPVATRSPDATSTPSPEPDGPRHVTLRTDAPGDPTPARIPYLQGRQLVENGQETVELPREYAAIARLGSGWVAQYADDGGNVFADVLDAGGLVERSFPSSWGLATDTGHDLLAVFDGSASDGELKLLGGDGAERSSWDLADGEVVTPVGVLGGDAVVYETEGVDPAVMVARADGSTAPVPGARSSGGVAQSSDLVTGMVSVDDLAPESCWNIFTVDGKRRWPKDRCEYSLGRFSPDESLVLGHPSYRDGIGDGLVAILALTGDPLVTYRTEDGAFVADSAWEDDTHILATVHDQGSWYLMRLDTAGDVGVVAGPVRADELSTPFHLPATP